ncbi:MAG: hypothetical protein JSS22_08710 [Proteobacteria bacterium]|nr:hypothetical protein [Pseudomonadota bacterium]
MRRSQRLIASAVLISLCGALAGCSSSLTNWDPSDMLDFLDTKKKLPGKRELVFPEGVPGVEQGVPKELYKSNVEQQQQEAAAPVVAPPPEEPKRARRSRAKRKPASTDAPSAGEEATPAKEGSTAAAAPPAPKPKRLVHRRATSLPKDQPAPQDQASPPQQPVQQTPPAASPFPAPLPSGSFSR